MHTHPIYTVRESVSSIVVREVREGHITKAQGFEVMRKCDPESADYDPGYRAIVQAKGWIAKPPAEYVRRLIGTFSR